MVGQAPDLGAIKADLVLTGSGIGWWEAVSRFAAAGAIILGMHSVPSTSSLTQLVVTGFVSQRDHALAVHLADDSSTTLEQANCDMCEKLMPKLFESGCDVSILTSQGMVDSEQAWAVFNTVYAAAAGWPFGYRLADRCIEVADFLGVNGPPESAVDSITAFCAARSCIYS